MIGLLGWTGEETAVRPRALRDRIGESDGAPRACDRRYLVRMPRLRQGRNDRDSCHVRRLVSNRFVVQKKRFTAAAFPATPRTVLTRG
jgi:hypothetical protein